jgi:hypothetical protein
MEVRVPAPAGAVDVAFLAALIDAFHGTHRRTFGVIAHVAGGRIVDYVP